MDILRYSLFWNGNENSVSFLDSFEKRNFTNNSKIIGAAVFFKSNRYNHEKNALNEILEILKRKQSSY